MKKLTTEEFIERSKEIHKDKYKYDKTIYVDNKTKVEIECPEHGIFSQLPGNHLKGHGCPECSNNKKFTTEDFIKRANIVHNNKYEYDKTIYINSLEKVVIWCPKHGYFEQNAHSHLCGCGCPECAREEIGNRCRKPIEQFIIEANLIHGNVYDYSLVNYISAKTPVKIRCLLHGIFLQTPQHHLQGCGCPICSESHLEREVRIYLESNNIIYNYEQTWDWLIFERKQSVDFYLPDLNIAIECQGVHHFSNVEFFAKPLEYTLSRDLNKETLCKEHGINLYYYSNMIRDSIMGVNFKYPYIVFENIDDLMNYANP